MNLLRKQEAVIENQREFLKTNISFTLTQAAILQKSNLASNHLKTALKSSLITVISDLFQAIILKFLFLLQTIKYKSIDLES